MYSSVTRLPGVIIKPLVSSPSGTLNLSFIDRSPELRVNVSLIFLYRHGEEVAEVFKNALSKALVPYYPLAGRLKENSNGELQVACTGEGVWLIEAFANYGLDSVNYYDNAFTNQFDNLLPTPPPESCDIDPLLQFQLTRFTSKGFTITITFCHSLMDGVGLGQFINAVAEASRGFPRPSIKPVWQREAFPTPAWLEHALGAPKLPPQSVPTTSYQLEHASLDISSDKIQKLKNEFLELTGEYCSTFDVVVGSLWKNRTRAIGFDQDVKVNLTFPVSARRFMDPPMPEGYYGNCLYRGSVTVSSGFLVKASNAEVVKLIRDAKSKLPAEFRNFMKSDSSDDSGDSLAFTTAYTTLGINDFTGLGFNKIDFGWGDPDYFLPAKKDFGTLPLAVLVLSPTPKKGICIMTCCVQGMHLQSLVQYYNNDKISRM